MEIFFPLLCLSSAVFAAWTSPQPIQTMQGGMSIGVDDAVTTVYNPVTGTLYALWKDNKSTPAAQNFSSASLDHGVLPFLFLPLTRTMGAMYLQRTAPKTIISLLLG